MGGDDLFREIADYPARADGPGVTVRMLDGLGFRFRWATEHLTEKEYAHRHCAEGMSLGEIVGHVWGLSNWMLTQVLGRGAGERPQTPEALRGAALENFQTLRDAVARMSEDDLARVQVEGQPFWHLINGPIADALTHAGQLNMLRRAAGNPSLAANVFLGRPPA